MKQSVECQHVAQPSIRGQLATAAMSARSRENCIQWNTQKRVFVAAAYALTANWNTTAQLWAQRFPDDFDICGRDLDQARNRISIQYREAKKKAKPWDGIILDRDYYLSDDGAEITRDILSLAGTIGLQLSTIAMPADLASGQRNKRKSTDEHVPRPSTHAGRVQTPDVPHRVPTIFHTNMARHPVGTSMPPEGQALPAALADYELPPYRLVTREEAHPGLPSLFYRFYVVTPGLDNAHALNAPSTKGFISGYHKNIRGGWTKPLAHSDEHMFTILEVSDHLHRLIQGKILMRLETHQPPARTLACDFRL